MANLNNFLERLQKKGIILELWSNVPWVYLEKINGIKVREKYESDHGFVIGYIPAQLGESFRFTDIRAIFNIIRKYTHNEKIY